MDYKEKYEKALDWIRSVYPTMNGVDKEDAEHFFPELKESEDERIRKWLISYFQEYKADGMEEYTDGPKADSMLAWLEKQGENTLIKEIKRRKKLLQHEKEKAVSFAERLSLGGRIAILEELLAFTNENQGEQRPAEWSEEDEKVYEKARDEIYYQDCNDKDDVLYALKDLFEIVSRKREVLKARREE